MKRLLLLLAVAMLSCSSLSATTFTYFCADRTDQVTLPCSVPLRVTPGPAASADVHVINLEGTGIGNHQVVWTSQATTTGLSVVIGGGTGTTYTTLETSTASTGSYTFSGAYRRIAVTITITSGGPVNAVYTGTRNVVNGDPCAGAKILKLIDLVADATLVTGTSGKRIHICAVDIGPIGTATNVALIAGGGTVCATGIEGLFGGSTAATGWIIGANGGLTYGTGAGTIAQTTLAGSNICIDVSAANQVSGSFMYAIEP